MKRFSLAAALAVLFGLALGPRLAQGDGIGASYRVTPDRGELAAASITGSALGSANTILTTTKQSQILAVENTCAVEVMLVANGANFKRVPAASFRVFDLSANGTALGAQVYKVYYTGSSPSSCNVEVVAIPYR